VLGTPSINQLELSTNRGLRKLAVLFCSLRANMTLKIKMVFDFCAINAPLENILRLSTVKSAISILTVYGIWDAKSEKQTETKGRNVWQ
jgi:hypothetical protein